MDFWFSENHTENVKLSIRVDKHLYTHTSPFQRIDIFESLEFGRFMTLDGYMMLTEKDEFIYHEMIVHIAMVMALHAKKVLVIGAGDGGAIRELCKYETIEEIDVVEIDEKVIEACKEYLPQTACAFDDKRVNIHIADGVKYIRRIEDKYDVIIVDSTDPFGPGEGVFTKEFYGSCYHALKKNGVMTNQHESPFYKLDSMAMESAHKKIYKTFPVSKVYQAHIPTYPSGHWLFGFASKGIHPTKDLDAQAWKDLKIKTKYYNTKLHLGSFALPTYVKEKLKNVE